MPHPHPLRTLSPAELEHASQQAHAWAGTKLLFFEIDLHEAASALSESLEDEDEPPQSGRVCSSQDL